jgi:hypothetical protein
MSQAAKISKALGGKRTTDGFIMPCPAHDDRNPSLSVKDTDDGLLVHCFAGCDWKEVKAKLSDMQLLNGEEQASANKREFQIVTDKYSYCKADGKLAYKVYRYTPKDFRPHHLRNGEWVKGMGGKQALPYRLDVLLANDEICFVEGEKDVESMLAAGIPATSKSTGTAVDDQVFLDFFSNKKVFFIPDNDKAGHKQARNFAKAMLPVAAEVRYCDICRELPPQGDMSDWLETNNADGLMQRLRGFPVLREEEDVDFDPSDVYPTIDADGMAAVTVADDFVEDFLTAGQMSVLYGPSNSGKTFFATDLALHVALGWRWRDRDVNQGGVLYVAAEGSYGIRNRIVAFRNHYGLSGKVPLTVIPTTVNLLNDDAAVQRLVNTIKVKAQQFGGISMVVLDTLARVMSGGNENSSEDMGALIANCDKVRQACDAHLMLVHHTGKDLAAGARGHSSLRAATDTEIEIAVGLDGSVASVTKQRELEVAGEFGFGLETLEIGTNLRGKPVTSCVVVPSDVAMRKRARRPSGKNQKVIFKALMKAVTDIGEGRSGPEHPFVRGVSVEAWQRYAYPMMAGESRHKSTAFVRAFEGLLESEFVGHYDDFVWVIGSD